MPRNNSPMAALMLAFAVLMSLPWLIPHTGFLALFGFVPLLMMERYATTHGIRRFWMWHYGAFVLWNAFTTFWVCWATVGGGVPADDFAKLEMLSELSGTAIPASLAALKGEPVLHRSCVARSGMAQFIRDALK